LDDEREEVCPVEEMLRVPAVVSAGAVRGGDAEDVFWAVPSDSQKASGQASP
jgi:hypothetical protein